MYVILALSAGALAGLLYASLRDPEPTSVPSIVVVEDSEDREDSGPRNVEKDKDVRERDRPGDGTEPADGGETSVPAGTSGSYSGESGGSGVGRLGRCATGGSLSHCVGGVGH
jgi:hypothetical protein